MDNGKECVFVKARKLFIKTRKNYRLALYQVMEEIAQGVVILETDNERYEEFVKDAHWADHLVKPDSKKKRNQQSLFYFGVDFVMRLKDEKLAWKRVRVLAFLIEVRKVAPADVATEMARLGGIERVFKLAVREDPRRAIRQSRAITKGRRSEGMADEAIDISGVDNEEWEGNANDERTECELALLVDAKTRRRAEKVGKGEARITVRGLGDGHRFRALKLKLLTHD